MEKAGASLQGEHIINILGYWKAPGKRIRKRGSISETSIGSEIDILKTLQFILSLCPIDLLSLTMKTIYCTSSLKRKRSTFMPTEFSMPAIVLSTKPGNSVEVLLAHFLEGEQIVATRLIPVKTEEESNTNQLFKQHDHVRVSFCDILQSADQILQLKDWEYMNEARRNYKLIRVPKLQYKVFTDSILPTMEEFDSSGTESD